jgi:predicted lipid-binding transport protein (Tim44 family)
MYSSSFFEIIIFALIAFVLVTKLIEMLGITDEDDPARPKSFFGEPHNNIKNVTEPQTGNNNTKNFLNNLVNKVKISIDKYDDLVVADNKTAKLKIINELRLLESRIRGFDPEKFINNAKKAFTMTAEALRENNQEILQFLVDKRFLSEIKDNQYGSLTNKDIKIESAQICEAYSFGNSVFIKILFDFNEAKQEEWVFIKNLLDPSPAWQISSINTL